MSKNFVSSDEPNADLRRKIETATDHESLREILKSDLAQRGALVREQDGNFAPAQAASANPVRENPFAEPGSGRFTQNLYLTLSADSPEQLAEMTRQVYAKFGKTIE